MSSDNNLSSLSSPFVSFFLFFLLLVLSNDKVFALKKLSKSSKHLSVPRLFKD
jgi:hypothetical protein